MICGVCDLSCSVLDRFLDVVEFSPGVVEPTKLSPLLGDLGSLKEEYTLIKKPSPKDI